MALFKKRSSSQSTGHAGDDQILTILATQHGPLDKPRHWVSTIVSHEQISRQVGIQPDSYRVRGSRSADPPIPVLNSWRIEAKERNGPGR